MGEISKLDRTRHDETSYQLADLFPSPDEIPAQFCLDTGGYVPCYLQDGEVRLWDGPLAPVSSPICLRQNGTIERPISGLVRL